MKYLTESTGRSFPFFKDQATVTINSKAVLMIE